MTKENFVSRLKESLGYGFIHSAAYQDSIYSPQLVLNNSYTGESVLTELQNQFETCQSFFFNVAFITEAGIAMLKSHFHDMALKGIKGRLMVSPYLEFNDPNALYELLKLPNVEVKMTDQTQNVHAKVYLFEHTDEQVMVAGSSNLTHTALKLNYEWNIKLTSSHNGELIQRSQRELEQLWDTSVELTSDLIENYRKNRKQVIDLNQMASLKEEGAVYTNLKPNKMQKAAIENLDQIRQQGANKALVISATGTGKTYLSAFDVKQYQPCKFLFIVHREQILKQAQQSFKQVIGFKDCESCIYRSGMDISDKKYVFATIQTLSRLNNLQALPQALFDYILIDEAHRVGAETYQTVLDHFEPHFMMGMTATPERTDDFNLYKFFEYNIAYEVRLQEALEEEMLTPFIYYGVSDLINEEGKFIQDDSNFSDLITEERVSHILDKIHYYGSAKQRTKGLIFCSRNDEAQELSEKLNHRGLKTKSLSGQDSQDIRAQVISALESGQLDYILTVDIFNEGVDIPAINQIIMLRQTKSSIIFIQQLGRGLRKYPNKEFVTIIDFIGNYENNYLIPMALFGDRSYNKDNYRRHLANRNQIAGITTVNFEQVAREKIFDSIQSATLHSMKNLKAAYIELKHKIGYIPMLMDFIQFGSLDPQLIFENKFNNHSEFVSAMEKEFNQAYSSAHYSGQVLFFLTKELMNGKRPHEIILFKELMIHGGTLKKNQFLAKLSDYGASSDREVIESVEGVVSLSFFSKTDQVKYGQEIIQMDKGKYEFTTRLKSLLEEPWYLKYFSDVLEVGLYKSKNYKKGYQSKLQIGQKYSRKDVSRLLNYEKNGSSTMYGYSVKKNTAPIFVNYHKSEKTNAEIKYEDEFLSDHLFKWFTKPNRKLDSKLENKIINHKDHGLNLHLFIKKDDLNDQEHYYLGPVDVVADSVEETMIHGKSIVKMLFKLHHAVPYGLFHYFVYE